MQMQMHCHEHKRDEYKQFTPLATYSVSPIHKFYISFVYSYTVLYKTWLYPTAPTFYINDYGTSVSCKCIDMNIKENNMAGNITPSIIVSRATFIGQQRSQDHPIAFIKHALV